MRPDWLDRPANGELAAVFSKRGHKYAVVYHHRRELIRHLLRMQADERLDWGVLDSARLLNELKVEHTA